jgi:hypothetical protein
MLLLVLLYFLPDTAIEKCHLHHQVLPYGKGRSTKGNMSLLPTATINYMPHTLS